MTLRCYCAVLFLLTLESFWFIRTRIVYMYKPCTKKILILWYLTLFCKSIISKICYLILSVWWNRDNNRLSVQGWTLKRLTKACLQHSKCLIVHFMLERGIVLILIMFLLVSMLSTTKLFCCEKLLYDLSLCLEKSPETFVRCYSQRANIEHRLSRDEF